MPDPSGPPAHLVHASLPISPPQVPVAPNTAATLPAGSLAKAPVADDRRPPGVQPEPPTTWPAPRIAGQVPGRGGRDRSRLALAVFSAFLAGTLVMGAAFAMYAFGDRNGRSDAVRSSGAPAGSRAGTPSPQLDIRSILDRAQPSVVSIQTGSADGIFGGAGSGVVISEDGLIVTNAHVISEAVGGEIVVRFSDGTTAAAKIVGSDEGQDIALVQANRTNLTPAVLGVSASLRVGDDVVAIGNALNLGGDPSVTRGIVSAKDRSISAGDVSLQHLIQTDAAINPGNSGGPLVNAAGEVVGINTAIIDGAQNVGFSLSIDRVKEMLPDLQAQGRANGGGAVLGTAAVSLDDPTVDQDTIDRLEIVTDQGALVTAVEPGSAAGEAGIRGGDVILDVDGSIVRDATELQDVIGARSPGDRVLVTVERLGQQRSFEVTLGSR